MIIKEECFINDSIRLCRTFFENNLSNYVTINTPLKCKAKYKKELKI